MNKISRYQAQQSDGSRPLAELSSAMLIVFLFICCPRCDIYLPELPGPISGRLETPLRPARPPITAPPGIVESGPTRRVFSSPYMRSAL
jgi:hypothetical protein